MVEFALFLVPGLSGDIVRGRVTNIVTQNSDTRLFPEMMLMMMRDTCLFLEMMMMSLGSSALRAPEPRPAPAWIFVCLLL